jgi:glutaconate CoA-transferase subunit A
MTYVETPPRGSWRADKVTSMAEALEPVVDGGVLALGGFTLYRRPVAAVRALIDRGVAGLTLIDYIGGFEADILVGSGCVDVVRSCYVGLEILGLAPMYRRMVAEGSIRAIPETEATVAYGLRAARARSDFLPARIWAGTEMLAARDDLQLVTSPYSGVEYVAVPAIHPDVTIVHAPMADAVGNAVLGGQLAVDVDLAAASAYTILTTEAVVSTEEIERQGADLLGGWVDAVVEVPRGAWPTSCHPNYAVDLECIADYVQACRAGEFDEFLKGMSS